MVALCVESPKAYTGDAPDRTHHPFLAVFFPVFTTLNISSSDIPLTFGNGTLNFTADSFRLFLIALDNAFAFVG